MAGKKEINEQLEKQTYRQIDRWIQVKSRYIDKDGQQIERQKDTQGRRNKETLTERNKH